MEDRHKVFEAALEQSDLYGARKLLGEWCAKQHGLACEQAFTEIQSEIVPQLQTLAEGVATLEHDPEFQPPAY